MARWLSYSAMFLFGVFVVFMGLMMVVAAFIRLYRAVDSSSCSRSRNPDEDIYPTGRNDLPPLCHSGVTEEGEKTYGDVARTGVADGAVCAPPG